MIQDIEVDYQKWIDFARKTWQEEWISSVKLAKIYDTKIMRRYCDRSLIYHAIRFDIGGAIKYWFHNETVTQLKEKCRKK